MNDDQKKEMAKVSASQLSSEAHFAYGFLVAQSFATSKQRIATLGEIRKASPMRAAGILSWAREFRNAFRLTFEVDFKDRGSARSKWFPIFEKGIQELMAFDLVEGRRDGHREWEVTRIHDFLCDCGCGSRFEAGIIQMN